jgi:hypothetical protein
MFRRKTSLITLLLIFLCLTSFEVRQTHLVKERYSGVNCSIDNRAFQPGEVMIYTIYYNLNFIWMPAGEVVFKVLDKGDDYHLVATGRTYPSYEWFYRVNDYYESYIDKETLLPKESLRDVQEGKFEYYDHINFDQANNQVTYKTGKKKDSLYYETAEVESCMHDILSIFYYMRNMDFSDFSEGDAFNFKVFLEKKSWELDVQYLGKYKERIKGLGRQNTILFSPETIAGTIFEPGDRMKVYVSDDDNRVPLLIESPVSVGSIKAVLQRHYGLRNGRQGYVK